SDVNGGGGARGVWNGRAERWGRRVKKKYQGIALPTSTWPLLSTYKPQSWITGGQGPGSCYQINPIPVLPLVAAPVPDLIDLAEDIQFFNSQAQLRCVGDPSQPLDFHLAGLGAQVVRFRFMIGVTTIADAHRFQLGTAH